MKGYLPSQERRTIPAISPEEVVEARKFFPLDKFFIFGHARSGTTLLTRLVRLHSDIHCNYQGHFFTRQPTIEALVNSPEIESWFTRRSNRWNQGRDLSPVVIRAAIDFILEREARPMNAKIVGDKSPNSLLNGDAVDLLHKVYPDGKLIFIVRDGRDAVISHRFQTFIDATQHLTKDDWAIRSAFESNPDQFLEGESSIFTRHGLSAAAEGWVRNVSDTDSRGKALFGDGYLSLRYEDLLSGSWDQMSRVWSVLGALVNQPGLQAALKSELNNNPDRDWQHEKAGSLVNSLQKGKTGSWQNLFTQKDKEIFRDIASEALVAWGYEETHDWD